jgi:hypothetical protein
MRNRTVPALLLLAVLCACRGNRSGEARISLPKDYSPTKIFTTTAPSLLVKAAKGADFRSIYSWVPDKEPRLIVEGRDLDMTRLSDDIFAAWYTEPSQEVIVTLNAQQLISPPLTLPNGGLTGWVACEGDVQHVVCLGNRPGMGIEDNDYDEMGFSAVLVIDLLKRTTSWFPLKDKTYFRFDPKRQMIYFGNSQHSVVAFDLAGKEHGSVYLSALRRPSPSEHFAESLQEDGEEWEVYDAASNKVVFAFNCSTPECKNGDLDLESDGRNWNPKIDGQFVALWSSGRAYGAGDTCDIYQSASASLVKRFPCGGLPVFDWSRDGRELVTLSYIGGTLHREVVN